MSILRRIFSPRQESLLDAVDTVLRVKLLEKVEEPPHRPTSPYGESRDLYNDAKRLIDAANYPEPSDFGSDFVLAWVDAREEAGDPLPHTNIIGKMAGAVAGIYEAQCLTELPPLDALYAAGSSGMARDFLLTQQLRASTPTATLQAIMGPLTKALETIADHLPALAFNQREEENIPTLPVIDLIRDLPGLVDQLCDICREPNDKQVLLNMAYRVAENTKDLSSGNRAASARNFKGTPREIVQKFLEGTGFEHILLRPEVPFEISLEDRGEHTAIVAGAGWGKTQLLQSIIAGDLSADDPPGLVIVDSTGAMVQRIQQLAIFNEKLRDRLLIIDPELDPVPALNPFDLSNPRFAAYGSTDRERVQSEVIELFQYVFSTINNQLTARMQTAFAFMVRLILSIDGSNIHTLLELLDDDPPKGNYELAKFKSHIDKLDATTQHFFKVQYYTGKESGLREQIRARVFDILRVPVFERMFSTINTVDFFTELNRGAIILVNTSENLLKDGSTTFGRYIIARCMAAAFERAPIPPQERRQAFLIVDEAAQYFDETFEKLLNRVRQFKLGVVIAFQNLDQASEKLKSTIASSTAVKYAGGTSYPDARWLSREMRVDPEFIIAQKRDGHRPPQWTQFACYVRNYTDRAISLTVPFYALEKLPTLSREEHATLLQRNRERVSAPAKADPVAEIAQTPLPPAAEASPSDTAETELTAAYAAMAQAAARSDWAKVSELQNDIIPRLQKEFGLNTPRQTTSSAPASRPVAASPDEPRHAATNPDLSRHAERTVAKSGDTEGATTWE